MNVKPLPLPRNNYAKVSKLRKAKASSAVEERVSEPGKPQEEDTGFLTSSGLLGTFAGTTAGFCAIVLTGLATPLCLVLGAGVGVGVWLATKNPDEPRIVIKFGDDDPLAAAKPKIKAPKPKMAEQRFDPPLTGGLKVTSLKCSSCGASGGSGKCGYCGTMNVITSNGALIRS